MDRQARPAFAAERHELILRLLAQHGRFRTVDVAAELSVAEPTVRKDIIELASRGLLRRTYGGAIAVPARTDEPTIASRSTRQVEAKRLIAARALALIGEGESIYLDNGTTVLTLAAALAQSPARPRSLNVVTNGIEVAQTVADAPGLRHILLGGSYRSAGRAVTGPLTLSALQQFSISTAFLGVSGLSENGFTVADLTEAQVKEAVIARSGRVVVLMDATKVGVSDFAKVVDLTAISTLITDAATQELAARCAAAGVELLTVS